MRRRALLGTITAAGAARAQDARPLRIVQPFPPGGATDVWARIVAHGMTAEMRRPVVVESRSGAAGMLAAEHVARAQPDGTTLLLTTDILIQAPITMLRSPIDPHRDLRPLGRLGHTSLVFVIGPAVPASVTDMRGFLHWAAGREVLLGHWGAGAAGHVCTLLLAREARLDATILAFRGEPPMLPELLAGRLHGGFVTTITFGEAIRAGQIRPLMGVGAERLPSLPPDVPSMQDIGLLPDFAYRSFIGLFGQANMPDAVAQPIAQAFAATATSAETVARLRMLDTFSGYEDGPTFAASMRRAEAQWLSLSRQLNLLVAQH